ncbi:MFS transporter [Daejeonella sp.]|jgi:MFS family permease|uniref:MFS transporter n=1 Tax=Daejeonella sp. TaxID=2805397 RepID=UPI0027B93856|nr:MFS transporter [Daejeonella sp.]
MSDFKSEAIKTDPYIAMRFPEFRSYIAMRFLFTFAYQVQAVVIGWHIYQLTKDPLSLGLIGLAEAIPSIMVTLYGGYIADKSDKKKLLIWIIGSMLCCSAVLTVVTTDDVLRLIGQTPVIIIIYVMIFFIGITRGFYSPTAFALMAQIIPKEHYANSSTWNSGSWQTASIMGPAVGGLLYAFSGITACFVVIVIFLALALGCIIFFVKNYPAYFVPKENIFKSLSEGIRFVFKSRMILGALSLDMFSVFFGGAVALMPIFAHDILKVGAEGLGFMRAAPALGAVITMFILAKYPPMNKPWRNLLLAVAGFGISIICFGLSRNFYLTLLCLFFEGAFDSVSVIIRSTILQILTPEEMRGRVSAVNGIFINSSNEIGAFESGATARLMGTIPSVIFGGSITIMIVIFTYFKTKRLVPLSLKQINNH